MAKNPAHSASPSKKWAIPNLPHPLRLTTTPQVALPTTLSSKNDRSAFFWANYRGRHRVIRMFLKHGRVDVNAAGGALLGNTALMWACLLGQADIVSELLAFPMLDVHAKNKAGSTTLDFARELQMLEIAQLLEARAASDRRRN